jgi:hypothetical protein
LGQRRKLKHFIDTTWKAKPPLPKPDTFLAFSDIKNAVYFTWPQNPCTKQRTLVHEKTDYWVECWQKVDKACADQFKTPEATFRYYCDANPISSRC